MQNELEEKFFGFILKIVWEKNDTTETNEHSSPAILIADNKSNTKCAIVTLKFGILSVTTQ